MVSYLSMKKECSKCKEILSKSYFYKDKRTANGLYSACKKCHGKARDSYKITCKARLRQNPSPKIVGAYAHYLITYRLIKCEYYKDIRLCLSKQEIINFFADNWEVYMSLYAVWKENNFQKKYFPSVDRIDPKGHYEIANMQIIPHHENSRRAHLGKARPKSQEFRENARIKALANWAKKRAQQTT